MNPKPPLSNKKIPNEHIQLSCSHEFSKEEIRDYITKSQAKFHKLKCLKEDCFEKITIEIIKKILSKDDFYSYYIDCFECKKPCFKKYQNIFECSHFYCKECLVKHYNIENKNQQQLKCPYNTCLIKYDISKFDFLFDLRCSANYDEYIISKENNCLFCNKNQENIELPCCERKICKICLKIFFKNNIAKCPRKKCNSQLNLSNIMNKEYSTQEKQENKINDKCRKCARNSKINISLDCGHVFCEECLNHICNKNHLNGNDNVICPEPNCRKEINKDLIKNVMPEKNQYNLVKSNEIIEKKNGNQDLYKHLIPNNFIKANSIDKKSANQYKSASNRSNNEKYKNEIDNSKDTKLIKKNKNFDFEVTGIKIIMSTKNKKIEKNNSSSIEQNIKK